MKRDKKQPAARRRWRPARPTGLVFRNGAVTALTAALALAAVVLANLLAGALPAAVSRFDLSETGLYTLGETSRAILAGLEQEVTIYYLAQTGSEDGNVTALLDQYAGSSDQVSWQQKDPVLYPGFARQLGAEDATEGSLILTSGDRVRLVDSSTLYTYEYDYESGGYNAAFDGENQITSAVQYVTAEALPVVCQVTGHGELALADGVQQALALQNLELRSLNLLTEDIPEDAEVLVIYSPASDYAAEDVETLRSWLLDGGRLLVCTDPAVETPNLDSLLEDWGLSRLGGLVVEGDSNYHLQGASYYLLPDRGDHPIDQAVSEGLYVLAPEAGAIQIAETLPDGVTADALLTTSASAYNKAAGYDLTTLDQEEGDQTGPFTLAVAAARTVADEAGEEASGEEGESRLVWLDCPLLLDADQLDAITAGGNGQFALGCLTWLADQDTTTLIAAKSLMLEGLSLSAGQVRLWAGVFLAVIPLGLIVAGILVTLKRRRG